MTATNMCLNLGSKWYSHPPPPPPPPNGCPVVFFSHTSQGAEIRHASIEKEA